MKFVATLAAAVITLTLNSSSLVAQAPRALTIEDYYRIKTVGDPQISQDGKWIAFTVTTRVEDDNTNAIDTFVVPIDGSASPRKISHEGKSVAQPRWTDDNLLQYSLNAKTNSDVFVGGTAPTPRIRPDSALFKVDIVAGSAPGTATPRTASSSSRWNCRPTPNISRITPISASCSAIAKSTVMPGVFGPTSVPASK